MRARVPEHLANELRAGMEARVRARVRDELLERTLHVLREEGADAFEEAWSRELDRIVTDTDHEFLEALRALEARG